MSGPQRIRLSRRRGWRKPEGTVVVARPTRWGNPFASRRMPDGRWFVEGAPAGAAGSPERPLPDRAAAHAVAAGLFEAWAPGRVDASPLVGRDLACWCPLDGPCHADVLLALAAQAAETAEPSPS